MRNEVLKRLAILVFIVFLLNTAGSFFGWYELLPWYDMVMHFLGGLWLSLVAVWVLYKYMEVRKDAIFSILLFVLVGAILWEVLEYAVQAIANTPGLLATMPDSISDVILGLIGGLFGGLYTLKKIRQNDKTN
jgi:uncharacterized membrane protein YjdF